MGSPKTQRILAASAFGILTAFILMLNPNISASVFNGGTIQQGIQAAAGVGGISAMSANELMARLIQVILSVVTTLAVLTIVIAGMFLILSIGDEGQKDKAKKIIQYTIIGIIVILLAQVIVDLVFRVFTGDVGGVRELVTTVVVKLLLTVLNIVTTIALLMLVVAGLYLIFSLGDEGQKDKAKKIIQYTIVGLIIILFARVIIIFVNTLFG